MAWRAEAAWPAAVKAFNTSAEENLHSLEGSFGRRLQVLEVCMRKCNATTRLTWGTLMYPLAALPLREVRVA